jgi:uncharacterized protein YneF (UPF0154 family)
MIETMVIMLASGIGTILGVLVFLRVLFKELEKHDRLMDYDEMEDVYGLHE